MVPAMRRRLLLVSSLAILGSHASCEHARNVIARSPGTVVVAVLVFPAGHLTDQRSYQFRGTDGLLRIDVEEIATDAKTVAGWRENAAAAVFRILRAAKDEG